MEGLVLYAGESHSQKDCEHHLISLTKWKQSLPQWGIRRWGRDQMISASSENQGAQHAPHVWAARPKALWVLHPSALL